LNRKEAIIAPQGTPAYNVEETDNEEQ